MVAKRIIILVVALLCVGSGRGVLHAIRLGQQASPDSHVKWVGTVLGRMETIKPGMTRGDLLKVFTTEGGLSQPLERTFVSRECLYFKVHVTFRAVGRPQRDSDGRELLTEDARDVIVTISQPFLGLAVIN
jgi:hypothetical protein